MCSLKIFKIIILCMFNCVFSKYLEGELHTHNNWAFLARFCFLSEQGEFEYRIEYMEEEGTPNLLLYYDTEDQWPSVYKTNKTCLEKESVLNIEQNQIINLTVKYPRYRDLAGCVVAQAPTVPTTPVPKYTVSIPTKTSRKIKPFSNQKGNNSEGKSTISISTTDSTTTSYESSYSDNYYTQFNYSSTSESLLEDFSDVSEKQFDSENIYENDPLNYTQSTLATTKAPIKRRSVVQNTPNINVHSNRLIICQNARRFQSSRERWWFVAISNCNNTKVRGIHIKYKILMTNGPPGDYWHEHFSADQFCKIFRTTGCFTLIAQYTPLMCFGGKKKSKSFCNNHRFKKHFYTKTKYFDANNSAVSVAEQELIKNDKDILPILMAFSIAYSFLILAIVLCTVELKSRQLLHSTYKLFVLSVMVQFLGIILQSAAYLKYAVNGVGSTKAKTFGSMFMGCSETCFLLLLLLLAKGYTTTRGRLPLAASVKLTVFMCLYSVTYICIFIYEAKVFDPGEVLYLYESPAGYGLIILRIMAWLMFIYSTVFTLKHYPEKSNFYYPFNICGTLWFIAGPAFILSANTYIDKWVRESVVCAVLLLIAFGGHLTFLILTMPSMANKNFPYHVRTTQIGIMEMTGAAGASTIEHFSHHVYEPASNVTEQTVIIPLTRRTEEIFGGLYSQHLQSNFARNVRHNNEDVPEEMNNAQNIAMQNVLSWSLAKNYSPLEVPHFQRLNRNSIGSTNSRHTERSSQPEHEEISRRSSVREENGHINESSPSTYEYVKDVPIELFTISKMVVTTNNKQNTETEK